MYNKTIILSEYDRRDRMRFIHKMRVIILFSTFFLCKHQNFGCVIVYICFFFRRHYIKKCEQMFKLQTEQDAEQV